MLGMILQRFKLIDHTRYQLKLKETPDHQARRLPHPGAAPDRSRPRAAGGAARRPRGRRAAPPRRRRPRRGPRPRHAAPRALRVEPRYRGGSGAPRGRVRARRAASRRRWRRSTSTPSACPPTGAVVIASASYNGTPPDNAARFCEWLRAADLAADVARGRALHRLRLRQPRLGVHLPGGPPAHRRAPRRARRRAPLRRAARATRATTSTGSSRPGTRRSGEPSPRPWASSSRPRSRRRPPTSRSRRWRVATRAPSWTHWARARCGSRRTASCTPRPAPTPRPARPATSRSSCRRGWPTARAITWA